MSANINAKKPTCDYLNVSLQVCFYYINHLCYAFLHGKMVGKRDFLKFEVFSPPSGGDAVLGKHSALAA